MKIDPWRLLAVALIASAVTLLWNDPTWAQVGGSGPLDGLVNATDSGKEQLKRLGKAIAGLVTVVLFICAMLGKVSWYWVGLAVVGTLGLAAEARILQWLTSFS